MSDEKLLKQFIKESIRMKAVKLSDGTEVDYGSLKHIDELDRIISDLDTYRRQLTSKPARKERYTISRAIDSIRHMKRKAKKSGIKSGLIKEDD